MDHSLHLTPPAFAPAPIAADARRTVEDALPKVRPAPDIPLLPTARSYLAQAVAARLQIANLSETTGEMRPDDRVLRPYGTPMLPYDKSDRSDQQIMPDAG